MDADDFQDDNEAAGTEEACAEAAPTGTENRPEGGWVIVGRRQLGPRGGRKPKFPTPEAPASGTSGARTAANPQSSGAQRRGWGSPREEVDANWREVPQSKSPTPATAHCDRRDAGGSWRRGDNRGRHRAGVRASWSNRHWEAS